MTEATLFSKIVDGEIPADIVYQDELVTAFKDIAPQAPIHFLIVPNKIIATVNDVEAEDEAAMGRMFSVARKLAEEAGVAKDGYRLIMNCNEHGGQEIFHVHLHLLGGQYIGRMVCNKNR